MWQAAATKVQVVARMSLGGQAAAARRAKLKLPEKKLGRSGHAKAPAAGQSTGEISYSLTCRYCYYAHLLHTYLRRAPQAQPGGAVTLPSYHPSQASYPS